MTASNCTWGDWMGSWKTNAADVDQEAERIDRQKASFGEETISRLKDLNVLILGCRGVGVETAKNLILSNVGGVLIVDEDPAKMADRGSNFYLTNQHVKDATPRAEACLEELKTLNPFCKVDICRSSPTTELLSSTNVLSSGRGLAAVVVTSLELHSKFNLKEWNQACRAHGIAFILAVNHGVSLSLFSDFGTSHEILDATGEPTQTLAVSNIEVLESKPKLLEIDGFSDEKPVVVVTVAQAEHGLDDGDIVTLDDMRGELESWNGRQVTVKRVAIASPNAAKLDTSGVAFKEALKLPTSSVLANFERQYEFYKEQHESSGNSDKKFPVRSITMFNRLALVLNEDDKPSAFGTYQAGGLLNQLRPPIQTSYQSFADTLERTPVPQMLRGEEWELGHGIENHLATQAVLDFYDTNQHWPRLHNDDDAKKMVELCETISEKRQSMDGACWSQKISWGFPSGESRDLDKKRLERFSRLFATELTGFCAFLGGAAAQEVLKKSGKFTPINQWIHHDEEALVVDECPSNTANLQQSRYAHQISIMGQDFQRRAAQQNVFLVGCGALGCEYLKGLALMGIGTGESGKVWVTDMDRIEVSNLSRQFLFRQTDVGHPKSVRGALAVQKWNPAMNIEALERKVGDDTEDFFDDAFWGKLDLCWNALDNVQARRYTDSKCLLYSKPLLESGTLGTKCNHEVILPYRTSTYNDGNENDDQENQIAMCTLRSFPYLPLHCIEFAKQSYFSDYFEFGPDQYETFRNDAASFFEQLESMDAGVSSLTMISSFLEMQKQSGGSKLDLALLIRVAFDRLIEDYRTSILNLCHSADVMEKSSGKKFWTGTKRRPRPVDWNDAENKAALMEYLYSSSGLYASVWQVECIRDRSAFEELVHSLNLQQPEWSPPSEAVSLNDDEEEAGSNDEASKVENLKGDLYKIDTSTLPPACPQEFEKDDDLNFHIDFLTCATNLRAWNYDIRSSPRHTVKVTAGRIIPALATTTAMVCGLVDIEFCKLVLQLQSKGRDVFLNSNINLAAGSGNFTTFCPDPPVPILTNLSTPKHFTSWDKITITISDDGAPKTVQQLVQYIDTTLFPGVVVDRIFDLKSSNNSASLYNAMDALKLDWEITTEEGAAPTVSQGVFVQWPQLRMAVQMLGRLPPQSNQRKVFEKQVDTVKKALDGTKDTFQKSFEGLVQDAHRQAYRPSDDDKDDVLYFDTIYAKRKYLILGVDCHVVDGNEKKDIHLPPIEFTFA
eukprot:CAMPEP_0178900650 /NCGR_PEP_ID=MMETSP0786-20121207/3584_1 /TAXON_ID=186022 /ORGANISM="Thalassionema frauenfeldii, Strain CCMP 1798" /LENGTH=1237 /DNA_ID=CAMNT_0020571663 /DNA_START=42 /DNA_END=3756 /DNA_ORIENTATION=+